MFVHKLVHGQIRNLHRFIGVVKRWMWTFNLQLQEDGVIFESRIICVQILLRTQVLLGRPPLCSLIMFEVLNTS